MLYSFLWTRLSMIKELHTYRALNMPNSLRRMRPLALISLAVSVFATSCLTDPAGPAYVPGFLALAPSFESSAAGIVDVDSVHVMLIRDEDETVALDTVVALTTDSDSVDLSFSIPVSSSSETFTLTLECLSPTGDVVFSAGPLTVTATTSGSDAVVAEPVPITYVGVGSDAASVQMITDLTYLHMGDTYSVEAQALDASGEPIPGTPIKWISENETRLSVPDAGVGSVQAGLERGWVHLIAQLLTGPADTIDLYVEPVPSEITIFSSNNQTGLVGTELPVVLEVQVNAPDGPVEGSPVDFTTGDGGVFGQASVSTNAEGYAWSTWTLGQNPGQQTATATVRNWPDLQATFTAAAVIPQEPTLAFTVQPSNTNAGATITPAVLVTAYNELGAVDTDFSGDVAIAIGTNPSNGTLSGTRTVTANAGVAAFSDLSIDAVGDGYTLAASTNEYLPATSNAFNITTAGQGGQVAWTNANGGDWSNGSNWSTGSPPTATDTAVIVLPGEYMVRLDVSAAVGVLVVGDGSNQVALHVDNTTLTVNTSAVVSDNATLWNDGNIAGSGVISVYGLMTWTSGTIGGSGVVLIDAGGMMTISSTPTRTLDQRQIINNGVIEWVRGDIILANGAVVENATEGQILSSPAGSISGSGFLLNAGEFVQDSPDSTVVQVPFSNAGTIDISVGWLVIENTFLHSEGGLLQGVGTFDVTNATITEFEGDIGPGQSPGILTVEGNLTLGVNSTVYIEIDGTTVASEYDRLDVSGNLGLTGTLDITMGFTPSLGNSFNVLGFGTVSGSFTSINGLNIGGGLELDPIWETTYLALDVIESAPAAGATINWTGAGDGTSWEDPSNWDLGRLPAALDTVYIAVDASYTVSLTSDATVANLTLSNSDNIATQVLEVAQGVTLQIDSVGYVAGQGQLWLSSGSLTGDGDLSIAGVLYCNGCTMAGPRSTTIMNGATMAISTGSGTNTEFDEVAVTNEGTLEWSGSNIVMDNGAQIVNNASMTITADDLMSWGGTGTEPQLINNGTIRRTLTETATSIMVPLTSNATSSLQLIAGVMIFSGNTNFIDAMIEVGDGGTSASLTFGAGTNTIDAQTMVTLGPDGLIQFLAGSATIAGSYDYSGASDGVTQIAGGSVAFTNTTTAVIPNLVVNGGILGGTGDILIANVLSWTAGRIEGSGAIEVNTSSNGTIGGTGLELSGRELANRGTLYVNGDGPTFSNGAVLNNLATGTIDFVGDFSLLGTGTVNNDGLLVKSAATGTSTRIVPDVVNVGTLDVQGGTIALEGTFTHSDGAILQGNGTIDLSNVIDVPAFDGDVNPGTSPGILNFIGDAIPGALSTANIEIGGLTAGTDHDRATVTGSFTANGTLNISVINNFTPQLGQTFTILTFASRTGEFSDTTGLSIDASLEFQLNWSATSLDLEVVNAPPVIPTDIVFFSDSSFSGDVGVFAGASDGSVVAKIADTGTPLGYLISPRWSQDKQRVAYTTGATGTNVLYMVNSDGTELTALVNEAGVDAGYPRWNSNGQHLGLVCRSGAAAPVDHICVIPNVSGPISGIPVNTYTTVTSFLPSAWQTGPPAAGWNPTGALPNQIFVARDSGLTTVSKFFSVYYDGSNPVALTAEPMQGVSGYLRVIEMDVSPDGSQIVFVGEDTQTGNEDLWVINTDGTGLTQITSPGASFADMMPVFSPNGSEVLFGREDDMCEISYWVANSDGSGERELATNAISCESDPNGLWGMDWSPDGSQIVLVGFDDTVGHERVYVVPSDVIPGTYTSVRVPVGRDSDSGLSEGQPNWRP